MFDVGFTELMLVGVIGLVILGPERLPVAARTVGKWVGKIKHTVGGVQREIQEELRLEEIRKKAKANQELMQGHVDDLRYEADLMESSAAMATTDTTSSEIENHSIGDVMNKTSPDSPDTDPEASKH
jgi:sec-independent protein translocase protein TatB